MLVTPTSYIQHDPMSFGSPRYPDGMKSVGPRLASLGASDAPRNVVLYISRAKGRERAVYNEEELVRACTCDPLTTNPTWISGSDVNSFCCYGLVYLLDSWLCLRSLIEVHLHLHLLPPLFPSRCSSVCTEHFISPVPLHAHRFAPFVHAYTRHQFALSSTRPPWHLTRPPQCSALVAYLHML